ncbi:hypothetical protein ACWGKQ_31540 [Streptomyces sp. NPDC054770]
MKFSRSAAAALAGALLALGAVVGVAHSSPEVPSKSSSTTSHFTVEAGTGDSGWGGRGLSASAATVTHAVVAGDAVTISADDSGWGGSAG